MEFVIYNPTKKKYASGPNALTNNRKFAKKFKTYREAEKHCAVGENPKRYTR